MIYLDYAGSGWPPSWLGERHSQYLTKHSLNPHGGSCFAENSRRAVLDAQRRVLGCLGLSENEAKIIWTSGCTEALNLAIAGFLPQHNGAIVVDGGAHPAMLEPCLAWKKSGQRRVTVAPLNRAGQIQVPISEPAPTMLAVCHVNNETGAVQNLPQLRQLWASHGESRPSLVVDAAQSFGRVAIPWREAQIDLLALSGRKLGGPASVGALVCRPETILRPLLLGGGQQGGWRPGTLDAVGILLFADAAEAVCRDQSASQKRAQELSARLWEGLATRELPPWHRLSPLDCDPHLASWSFPGYEGAVLVRLLAEQHGILIAAGSGCSAESGKTSHVLAAMGYDKTIARGTLRVSFGHASTTAEVDALLNALKTVLKNY